MGSSPGEAEEVGEHGDRRACLRWVVGGTDAWGVFVLAVGGVLGFFLAKQKNERERALVIVLLFPN